MTPGFFFRVVILNLNVRSNVTGSQARLLQANDFENQNWYFQRSSGGKGGILPGSGESRDEVDAPHHLFLAMGCSRVSDVLPQVKAP